MEMALRDDIHAIGCGCQPCRVKRAALEKMLLARNSLALEVHDSRN